jgi:hypothetical protein
MQFVERQLLFWRYILPLFGVTLKMGWPSASFTVDFITAAVEFQYTSQFLTFLPPDAFIFFPYFCSFLQFVLVTSLSL